MSNNRPLILLACAVLLIVGASLWFLNSGPSIPVAIDAATPTPSLNPRPATPKPRETGAPTTTAAVATPNTTQNPRATPRPLEEWELRIDEVLRSSADETQTAQILINLLPTLPLDGQSEAAQHISNLILDDQYNRVLPLVKNPNLPEDVLDVFVTDLMNREDAVKLPALLEIAKTPNHPHHEEALTDLQIFTDETDIPPNDWGRWDVVIKDLLKKQAAEEAAENAAPPPTGLPPGAAAPGGSTKR